MGLIACFAGISAGGFCEFIKKVNLSDESITHWKAEFLHSTKDGKSCVGLWPQTILRLKLHIRDANPGVLVEKLSHMLATARSEQFLSDLSIRGIDDEAVQLIFVSKPNVTLQVRSTRKNKVVLHAIKNVHLALYQRKVYV